MFDFRCFSVVDFKQLKSNWNSMRKHLHTIIKKPYISNWKATFLKRWKYVFFNSCCVTRDWHALFLPCPPCQYSCPKGLPILMSNGSAKRVLTNSQTCTHSHRHAQFYTLCLWCKHCVCQILYTEICYSDEEEKNLGRLWLAYTEL